MACRCGRCCAPSGATAWPGWSSVWWTARRRIADGLARIEGAEVRNDVVFTQVCATFGDDERTRAVTARLLADGTAWMSGSRWHDRDVLRVSVSNWSTDEADVALSVDAVARATVAPG